MKLLIDLRICDTHKYGGVSRYAKNVVKNFPSIDSDIEYGIISNGKRFDFLDENLFVYIDHFISKDHIEEQKLIYMVMKSYDFDILFSPWFFSPITNKIKNILVIHDLLYFKFKQYYQTAWWEYLRKNFNDMMHKSDGIISVSNNTRKDILEFSDVREDKIRVIHEAVEDEFAKNVSITVNGLPDKYILFVGKGLAYKNLKFILQVIGKLDSVNIVCAGTNHEDYKTIITENNLSHRVKFFDEVTDDELACLYNKSTMLVFPSSYEGFGLPILEAQKCGCPVICTNSSSFPEVGVESVIYAKDSEFNDWSDKISKLYNDESIRKKYRESGYKNIKRFSWRGTSKEVLEFIKTRGQKGAGNF